MKIPISLRNKEVIVFNLSVEVVRRYVEVSRSSVEVKMHSGSLRNSSFPRVMIHIGVERMIGISPGIIKAFDFIEVILLTSSNHQIVILNHTTISKSHLVAFRVDLIDSDVIRLSNVFADQLSSGCRELKFGDAMLCRWYLPCS